MDPIIDGIIAKLKQPQDFHIYILLYCLDDDEADHQNVILETFSFQKNPSEEKLKETVGCFLHSLMGNKRLYIIDKYIKSKLMDIKQNLGEYLFNIDEADIDDMHKFIYLGDKIQNEFTFREVYDYYFCGSKFSRVVTLSLTKLSITNIE